MPAKTTGTAACYDYLVFFCVPDMIKAYLGEEAILKQARSYDLWRAANCQHVRQTLDSSHHLVIDETHGEFEERHVDPRVFAVQNGRGEATFFPGGLTRVSETRSRVTDNSSGGSCKPTWVVR